MSPDPAIYGFFGGALTLGFLVAAVFFLKFWRRTGDKLFAAFAAAFALLAVNQAVPVLFGIPREEQGYVYLLRLAGFGLIIWAVLAKNLARRR
jgi:zinc transporter ZupT